VKAFRLFTGHQTAPRFFPKDLQAHLPDTGKKNLYYKDIAPAVLEELWARFFEALQPLHAVGKLGSVLFQFPHWVTAVPKARAHVEHCAERMHPFLTAFEFRHESWFSDKHRDSTLAMERELPPDRSVKRISGLRAGVLENGRRRPHPIGHKATFALPAFEAAGFGGDSNS